MAETQTHDSAEEDVLDKAKDALQGPRDELGDVFDSGDATESAAEHEAPGHETLREQTPGADSPIPGAAGQHAAPEHGQRTGQDQARPGGTEREQEAGKEHPLEDQPGVTREAQRPSGPPG